MGVCNVVKGLGETHCDCLKPIMFTREWLKAALIRAVRTFAEAALAYIGTGACVLGDVNWLGVLSAGAFGAVTAILLALAGLPEAEGKPIE